MLYKESIFNLVITENDESVVIFNTLRGVVSSFDIDIYKSFHNKTGINSEVIDNQIIKCGFVVEEDANEYEEVITQMRQTAYNNSPGSLHFVIAPTMKCNYKCLYCFEKETSKNCSMTNETAEKTIAFICNEINKKNPRHSVDIQWFGGEPLLAIESIKYISTKLKKFVEDKGLEYVTTIITNGYYLDSHAVDVLKKYNTKNVQITLDGTKKTYSKMKGCSEDCFDRVIGNIKSAEDELPINIRMNMDASNVDDIYALTRYLVEEAKIKSKLYIADIRNYDGNNTEKNTFDFEAEREKIVDKITRMGFGDAFVSKVPVRRYTSCKATTKNEYVIGPTGKLYRCAHLLDREGCDSGDIYKGYIASPVDNMLLQNELPTKCRTCPILPICLGACACDRLIDGIVLNCESKIKCTKYEVKRALSKGGVLYDNSLPDKQC